MSAAFRLVEARALAKMSEWGALCERVSALPEAAVVAEPELAVLYADSCRRIGQALRSLEVGERLESSVRRTGRKDLTLRLTNVIGMALFEAGRMEEAARRFQALLDDATAWRNVEFTARAANNQGIIANVQGRRDLALSCYQHALAAYQGLGHFRGLAQTHHNLGISYRDLGLHAEADAHYRRAIEFGRKAGSEDVIALAELERAVLRAMAGDGRMAEALARRASHRFRRLGDPVGRAEALRVLAAAARADGRNRLAEKRLDAAFAVAREHQDQLLLAEVRRDQGVLLRDRGDHDGAHTALLESADHYERIGARAEAIAVRGLLRDHA
jgi:tetratricopeptide (TPR) repeat protein